MAAPPLMTMPAPESAAAVMIASCSRSTAEYGAYFFSSQAFQKWKNGPERKSPRNSLRTTLSPNQSPNLICPTSP